MQPKMKVENFVVTCLNCKGSSRIRVVNDKDIMYVDHTPIISCRLRGDMKWGFECMCGNDSRLAREEKEQADMLLQQGSEQALKGLIASLKVADEKKFAMEASS